MIEEMTFRPAARTSVKLLIGLLGASGGGKTLSALLLGRGIVGEAGKLALADTESGRGEVFSDMVPGGYGYFGMEPPFSPLQYVKVMDVAEAAGVQCLVIDSATHEWSGEGGYLDLKEAAVQKMAGDDWAKREKCAMAAAAQVKPKTHAKFYARVCRSKMAVILCFRGKDKVKIQKNQAGKTEVKKDDHMTAIQDTELIFECLLAGEVFSVEKGGSMEGGFFRCIKHTHPDVLALLPREGEQIGVNTGELIAEWASGGKDASKPAVPPKSSPAVATLKRKLFALTEGFHHKDQEAFWSYLLDAGIIGSAEHESRNLSEERLIECIEAVEEKQP